MRQTVEKRRENPINAEDVSAHLHLSCGHFDSPAYAQNLGWVHTQELAGIFGDGDKPLPVHSDFHVHITHGWVRELSKTMPVAFRETMQHEHRSG